MEHATSLAVNLVSSSISSNSVLHVLPQQTPWPDHTLSNALITRATETGLSNSRTVVTYSENQTFAIQVVATSMASISITASVTALYWFCRMRRNYRRDLVLLLILSDLLKNFCFVLFAAVNFNAGPVQSHDNFCQASGFLLQTGLEACDYAIFFISLHMVLQIFPKPNTIFGYDGLYNVRYWVYALWFTLPTVSASLAFINDSGAYAVQGTWCWLPVRPFWYRLALAWVPRYIIASLILGFAIAIYVHVGAEFKLFGIEHGRSASDFMTSHGSGAGSVVDDPSHRMMSSAISGASLTPAVRIDPATQDVNVDPFARNMFVSPAVGTAMPQARRHSLPTWTSPFDAAHAMEGGGHKYGSQSEAPSRRGSRQVTFEGLDNEQDLEDSLSPTQQPTTITARPSIVTYVSSAAASFKASLDGHNSPKPSPANVDTSASIRKAAEVAMKARNHAIRRQVRGLFAYPIAYIAFWIMPFVMHCMNYSARYAVNPLFPVALLASLSITSLGLIDVVIFCWRERPWRHIAASDGSFLGSFSIWHSKTSGSQQRRPSVASNIAAAEEKEHMNDKTSDLLVFLRRFFPWRRSSSSAGTHDTNRGGSDRQVRESESAQARLKMERRELREQEAATEARQASIAHFEETVRSGSRHKSPGHRNWFDHAWHDDSLDQETIAE